jgi:hypothetical protein
MYQTGSSNQAYSDAVGDVELVDIELAPDARLAAEDPENFDLFEWAIEFSKAVGFEMEHGPVVVKD